MIYNKLFSIFFIALMFFSCANDADKDDSSEVTNHEEITNNNVSEIKGNTYVITQDLNNNEDIIAEFDLLNGPLGKYFIVEYNSEIHKESQVLLAQSPLKKNSFDDGNYIFVQHAVNNFEEWEKNFLLFEGTRKAFNIEVISVVYYYNDPNNVIVIASYKDFSQVSEYGQMITGAKAMSDAGVVSTPEILLMTK
jgi:hypothetical protein